MNTPYADSRAVSLDLFSDPAAHTSTDPRTTMNGKPVVQVPAKSVVNLESGFAHKLLCDGPTFSTGSACAYSCSFCYVPELMRKSPHLAGIEDHAAVVIRREGAIAAMRAQLLAAARSQKHAALFDAARPKPVVIYASPLVDVAANLELVEETVAAVRLILDLTPWDVRLLSKSHLLPRVAEALDASHAETALRRVIYGVSTGTLDDNLARAFEGGTALVRKRLRSLHQLQDQGNRTFGMLCPSLPQRDYLEFAGAMREAIRADRCEHVWGEIINVRGDSMTRTVAALRAGGYGWEAAALAHVGADKAAWELYSRATFQAHVAAGYRPGQLRFLQYAPAAVRPWWAARQADGAILL